MDGPVSLDICVDMSLCQAVVYNPSGAYQTENSWSIINSSGDTLVSGNGSLAGSEDSFGNGCDLAGCTNSTADNYNPDAVVDDGSCQISGCTDSNADNCLFEIDCMGECSMIMSGCMLQDAPNYCVSAILPCTTNCVNGQMGSNCCCEEIIYGCLDEGAINYSETANAPCVELVAGIETPNACCIESIIGCLDEGANNYNPLANVDDGSCEYSEYGCMNDEACNYNLQATLDCNAENAETAGSEWVQNDDCCDLTYYTTCYLDLNNNGFYEEILDSISMCDCGELGVGWVNEDAVNGFEVQGCTQVMIDGQICPEYTPQANVDNGSCCLTEFEDEDDSFPFDLIGLYNVDFEYGMLNNNGECIADTMMEMGGPDIIQITFGPPDSNGVGQMQYFEEYQNVFDSHPDWEFHVPDSLAQTEDECMDFSEENGSDWHYCDNWGSDFQNCEDNTNHFHFLQKNPYIHLPSVLRSLEHEIPNLDVNQIHFDILQNIASDLHHLNLVDRKLFVLYQDLPFPS
jgi:hypothetical protein